MYSFLRKAFSVFSHSACFTLLCLFTGTNAAAQFSENFEAFADRDSYLPYGYEFAATDMTGSGAINGSYSLQTGALSNAAGTYRFRTGYLNLTGSGLGVSFRHRTNNNSSGAQLRVSLIDATGAVVESSTWIDTRPAGRSETISLTARTGWFRLQWDWRGNGGNSRGLLDDIAITAPVVTLTGRSTRLSDIATTSTISLQRYGSIDSAEFVFRFQNFGPDVANSGRATITLPGGFAADRVTVVNGTFNTNNNTLTMPRLAVGESAVLTIRSRVFNYGSFSISSRFVDFAFQIDPVSANNTSTANYLGGTILPVTLRGFAAQRHEKGVRLSWQTGQEEEGLLFIVEKSSDGILFSPLTEVKGRGTASGQAYQYLDETGTRQITYFRLKAVGKNNATVYSTIVIVKAETNLPQLALAPNPAQDQTRLTVFSRGVSPLTVVLTNAAGHQVQISRHRVPAGNSSIVLPLHQLKPGVYQVSVSDGERVETKQLLKQ